MTGRGGAGAKDGVARREPTLTNEMKVRRHWPANVIALEGLPA